jgi:dienelactone hydrolase
MTAPLHVRLSVAIAAMTLLAACAGGLPQAGTVPPQAVPGSRMPDHPLAATLTLPTGQGPFPAVILLHGCGGVSAGQRYWVSRLTGWGYAVLLLDSFSARGVTTVCAPANQHLVTAQDRAGDVLSAALYLRTLPDIDGARIGVLGESHGGTTAAVVTQARYQLLYPGLLKASVDYYGACRAPEQHGTVPLLALAGDADDWGQPAATCSAFGRAMKPNQPFEIHTYPGVVHAFDNPNLVNGTMNEGHRMQYNAAAADESFTAVKAFLDKYLAAPGSA